MSAETGGARRGRKIDHRTVRAIADTIVRESSAADGGETDSVAEFLLFTLSEMPDHIGLPLRTLTRMFGAWSYLRNGKPFHALSFADREAQIRAWETSRLGFRRNLIGFYRPLATFRLYSDIESGKAEIGRR